MINNIIMHTNEKVIIFLEQKFLLSSFAIGVKYYPSMSLDFFFDLAGFFTFTRLSLFSFCCFCFVAS